MRKISYNKNESIENTALTAKRQSIFEKITSKRFVLYANVKIKNKNKNI